MAPALALIAKGRLQTRAPLDYEWPGVSGAALPTTSSAIRFLQPDRRPYPAGSIIGMQLHWLESLRSADARRGKLFPGRNTGRGFSAAKPPRKSPVWDATPICGGLTIVAVDLAVRRGWAERLLPDARRFGARYAQAGMGRGDRAIYSRAVYCGMHDSNAALLAARSHPELAGHDVTVLSTGTWFVAMRTPTGSDRAPRCFRKRAIAL